MLSLPLIRGGCERGFFGERFRKLQVCEKSPCGVFGRARENLKDSRGAEGGSNIWTLRMELVCFFSLFLFSFLKEDE